MAELSASRGIDPDVEVNCEGCKIINIVHEIYGVGGA
jgi:hypothetical protein